MNFLKPWLMYLVSALILCVVYCGLEKANGKIGLTTKSIASVWIIITFIVTSGLFGIQSFINNTGRLPPIQVAGVTLGASCVTLLLSSVCVYCAA